MTERKRIALLGSTGSIGRQTLEVIAWHPDRFEVVGLAARSDAAVFQEQVQRFRPKVAALTGIEMDGWSPDGTRLCHGERALVDVATAPDVDLVMVATAGTAGVAPTIAALELGRPVALANKEVLIMAGHIVTAVAREHSVQLIPVDSEHSAIWQVLLGEPRQRVKRLILTASGGAFRDLPAEALRHVTPAQALTHPNWKMGPKITVDSATLMNKGLEVLEAGWLFDVPLEDVDVLMHRESIVHSMIELVDGSIKAQLSHPDMRLPIQFALTYPDRLPAPYRPLDLATLGSLTFGEVDWQRFRCAHLAIQAGRQGGSYPAAMNAANEVAVELFLNGLIRFDQIPDVVEDVMSRHVPVREPNLDEVCAVDAWAREVGRRVALSATVS